MKTIIMILLISLFSGILLTDCQKNNRLSSPSVFIGTVIGYDPCYKSIKDSSSKGYVIEIEKGIGEDTTVIDTAMTYNLPNVFVFHPQLFTAYNTYLFPLEYRDNYKFKFSYMETPKKDWIYSYCATVFLMPVFLAPQKQITIIQFYGKIQTSAQK